MTSFFSRKRKQEGRKEAIPITHDDLNCSVLTYCTRRAASPPPFSSPAAKRKWPNEPRRKEREKNKHGRTNVEGRQHTRKLCHALRETHLWRRGRYLLLLLQRWKRKKKLQGSWSRFLFPERPKGIKGGVSLSRFLHCENPAVPRVFAPSLFVSRLKFSLVPQNRKYFPRWRQGEARMFVCCGSRADSSPLATCVCKLF